MARCRLAHLREIRPLKLGPAQIGILEPGFYETSTPEPRMFEAGFLKFGITEIGTFKLGGRQIRTLQLGVPEIAIPSLGNTLEIPVAVLVKGHARLESLIENSRSPTP